MNKKCVASAYLPKHSSTKEFSVHELMLPEGSDTIKVTISSTGLVCAKSETFTHQWIKCAKMAKGVHEQNAILVRSYGSTLMLDIVKDIKVDEEIFLWFSEEVQALMGISFLGLGNIQGENRYICTKCNKSFENPNPLKVHIALNCERYSSDILWRRLLESIDFPRDTSFFSNQLNYMSHYFNTINIQRHTMPHAATTHPKTFFNSIIGNATPPPPANSASPIHLVPQANANLETATHLETLVSNMGTSRNGHVCIYCGKLYSRKYGLKIHIRTHTGFKPLKCKFCLRPFGDPSNLNKHLRLHTQNGKETARYRCTICNKNLVRRRDLVRHVQAKHKLIHMEADALSLSSMSDEDMDLTKDIEVSN